MNTIDKLYFITDVLFDLCDKIEDKKFDLTEEQADNIIDYSKDIRKDLRRLEKLESRINELYDIHKKYKRNNIETCEKCQETQYYLGAFNILKELRKVCKNDK